MGAGFFCGLVRLTGEYWVEFSRRIFRYFQQLNSSKNSPAEFLAFFNRQISH